MNILFTVVLAAAFVACGYFCGRRDDKRYIPLVVVAFMLAADPWRCASESLQTQIAEGSPLAKLATVTILGAQIGSLDIAFAAMLVALIVAVAVSQRATAVAIAGMIGVIAGGIFLVRELGGFLPGTYFLVLGILPAVLISRRQIWEMPRSDRLLIAIGTPLCLAIGMVALLR